MSRSVWLTAAQLVQEHGRAYAVDVVYARITELFELHKRSEGADCVGEALRAWIAIARAVVAIVRQRDEDVTVH
jgi:hypothetical protein